MIIFGDDFIESEPFYHVEKVEDISKTVPNSTIVFKLCRENLELCKYAKENSVSFALHIDSVNDILYANLLEASFMICQKKLCEKAQKLADEYMFDTKILLYSEDKADLEWAANLGIDGIIFKKGIK